MLLCLFCFFSVGEGMGGRGDEPGAGARGIGALVVARVKFSVLGEGRVGALRRLLALLRVDAAPQIAVH